MESRPSPRADPASSADSPPLERRVSFDGVAEIYDRVRHSYPAQAFADLFAYLREQREVAAPEVLEIGPGTGKATRGLLDAGGRVTAVELGSRMAEFLRAAFANEPALTVVEGSFEEVDLAPSSFDVVTAATAFHWIDPAVRVDKSIELLRPSGVLATLATVQVRSQAEGFFEMAGPIYAKYQGDDQSHGYIAPSAAAATPPEFEELRAHPHLRDAVLLRYRWDQTYSSAEYADLLRSYSNMQMMPSPDREALITELCELLEAEFGGQVVRPLVIALAMARRGVDVND
ncbi:MAG TPA: class I SAM-dependent methyltransferase [Acidimicrobiales bacterium]|nr:class I SAM-dependent methyltransferase [Acidimicrobiales bacterium]